MGLWFEDNYHVNIDGQFYSVPYEYIKRKVDIRLTRHTVEVFFENARICSHVRLYGRSGQYNTVEEHMPPHHRQYAKWNGERFRQWASNVGPQTACVVDALLTCHKVEQQGYRSCMALLNLSDKYSPLRLEAACAKVLQYSFNPSFKSVEAILKSGRDKISEEKPAASNSMFGLTRGADYYGKEQD